MNDRISRQRSDLTRLNSRPGQSKLPSRRRGRVQRTHKEANCRRYWIAPQGSLLESNRLLYATVACQLLNRGPRRRGAIALSDRLVRKPICAHTSLSLQHSAEAVGKLMPTAEVSEHCVDRAR